MAGLVVWIRARVRHCMEIPHHIVLTRRAHNDAVKGMRHTSCPTLGVFAIRARERNLETSLYFNCMLLNVACFFIERG